MDNNERYKWVLDKVINKGALTTDEALAKGIPQDRFIVAGTGKEFSEEDIERFLARGARRDRRCMGCQEQVYLSPASEQLVAEMAEPRVLCLSCAMAMSKGEKDAN